eukprot:gene11652-11797_t
MLLRRCRSEGQPLFNSLQQDAMAMPEVEVQGLGAFAAGHLRTISLDTRASDFLQSLQLHDASGGQLPLTYGEQAVSDAATAVSDEIQHGRPLQSPANAGSVRDRLDSEGGKRDSLHQHKNSFTPALPDIDESTGDDTPPASGRRERLAAKERRISVHWDLDDDDYDSDKELQASGSRRGSGSGRGRSRRGGYNGRSENELLLLDPKRVKRIMANRQSAARSKERRMNYTMQLESKLQSLNQEAEKLKGKLEALQGQGKQLTTAEADLSEQAAAELLEATPMPDSAAVGGADEDMELLAVLFGEPTQPAAGGVGGPAGLGARAEVAAPGINLPPVTGVPAVGGVLDAVQAGLGAAHNGAAHNTAAGLSVAVCGGSLAAAAGIAGPGPSVAAAGSMLYDGLSVQLGQLPVSAAGALCFAGADGPAAGAAAMGLGNPAAAAAPPRNSWPSLTSPAAQGGGVVGATGGPGGLSRGSPAYSDPLGGEGCWPDDVSSGSLAGSLTPNYHQSSGPYRLSDTPDQVDFTMGVNPAALHRFAHSLHHRSASAGSVLGGGELGRVSCPSSLGSTAAPTAHQVV